LFGMAFEKVVVFPLRRQQGWEFTVIIVTLGCALVLDSLLLVSFGPLSKSVPRIIEGSYKIGNFAMGKHDLLMLVIALAVVAGLSAFLSRTWTGLAMRAVSQDNAGARMVGMPLNRLYTITFGIAAGLSAIAAILLAPRTLLYPLVGWTTLLKSFVVIVLGGLGNLKGAVIAAFMLAIVEVFVTYLVGGIWALPIFLVAMVVILVIKPKGLFGSW
jgi:branched-chain amino acid transport system permease protein